MSIIYSVTVTIDAAIEPEWVVWMRDSHIPDVLETGCFFECRMYKVLDAAPNERIYVMQYHCRSVDDYQRYQNGFAPALQQLHSDRFDGRFRASRQLLDQVAQVGSAETQNV